MTTGPIPPAPPNPPNSPNQPSGHPGGRRRRRKRGGAKAHQQQQQQAGAPVQNPGNQITPQAQPNSQPGKSFGSGQQRPGGQGGQNKGPFVPKGQRRNRPRRGPATFVGPMDHSYRGQNPGNSHGNGGMNGHAKARLHQKYDQQQPNFGEPDEFVALPIPEDAPPRIYAFIDDLFFYAKISEISRKTNVKVEFVKTEKELFDKVEGHGNEVPSLIMVDLNSGAKPLMTIPKLRKEYKKGTSIVGFVSHVQGDLKLKATEAGCDVVMPRSAFSQNLPSLLRRHGVPDSIEDF